MSLPSLYIHRVTVQRATRTADNYGGATETWPKTENNLACRMVPVRGEEGMVSGQGQTTITWHMFFASGKNVQEQDKVTFGNKTLYVFALRNPDHMDRFNRADLTEVLEGSS